VFTTVAQTSVSIL